MDLRLKQLSYSSNLLLHSCPRKYQLYKLESKVEAEEDYESSVTFAYGHVVGYGIQCCLEGLPITETYWKCFQMWEPSLLAVNEKQMKSFWLAMAAVEKFYAARERGFLAGWNLVYHEGRAAVELGFAIDLGDSFFYRGYVDAVLQEEETGEVMVLEVKTTSANLNAATYKNSSQAIGYSIILDHLFPSLSSYKVMYLVYKTKAMEFEQLPFDKSYLQRALWIQELLLERRKLEMYEEVGVYPMHGESCYSFYRECQYLNICTLSTATFATPISAEDEARIHKEREEKYQVQVSLHDLIQAQLRKEKELGE